MSAEIRNIIQGECIICREKPITRDTNNFAEKYFYVSARDINFNFNEENLFITKSFQLTCEQIHAMCGKCFAIWNSQNLERAKKCTLCSKLFGKFVVLSPKTEIRRDQAGKIQRLVLNFHLFRLEEGDLSLPEVDSIVQRLPNIKEEFSEAFLTRIEQFCAVYNKNDLFQQIVQNQAKLKEEKQN